MGVISLNNGVHIETELPPPYEIDAVPSITIRVPVDTNLPFEATIDLTNKVGFDLDAEIVGVIDITEEGETSNHFHLFKQFGPEITREGSAGKLFRLRGTISLDSEGKYMISTWMLIGDKRTEPGHLGIVEVCRRPAMNGNGINHS
ncbi:hypothetical protein FQN55_005044 [Onygenales sp. PD_40]|nr:hypothetical protein FQN55_005044 [Onygenales sp. PD_40]